MTGWCELGNEHLCSIKWENFVTSLITVSVLRGSLSKGAIYLCNILVCSRLYRRGGETLKMD